MLLKSEKQAIMKEYARFEGDTGSPEVQIAVLTERINRLTEALQGAQARLSFSERSDEDGRTPQKSARVPEEERSGALQDADRPSGSA